MYVPQKVMLFEKFHIFKQKMHGCFKEKSKKKRTDNTTYKEHQKI